MRRTLFLLSLAVVASVISMPALAQETSRHITTWYFDATTGEHTGTWIQGCGQTVGDPSSFDGVTWKTAGWATYTSMVVERWACPYASYRSNFTWATISDYCQIQTVETYSDDYYVCDLDHPFCGYTVSTNQVCKTPFAPKPTDGGFK